MQKKTRKEKNTRIFQIIEQKINLINRAVSKILAAFIFFAISSLLAEKSLVEDNLSEKIQNVSVYIPKIKTEVLKEKTLKNTILLTGELESLAVVNIKSKVQGRIESLALKDGREASETVEVKAQDILAVLDSADFKTRLQQAEASQKTAAIAVSMAKTLLEDKSKDKTRMENLFAKGAISLKQKELALLDYSRCWEQLQQAEASLELAEASVERARLLYEEAFIKAPFDGVLVKRYVSLGDLVGPGVPLFCLQKAGELKLLIKVPERMISQINLGTEVEVQVDAWEGRKFLFKIEKVYPVVDPLSRCVTVELRIDATQAKVSDRQKLFPGMFARARLILEKKENILAVPASSIIKGGFIYVFRNGKVHLTKIDLGLKENDLVEVISGLKEGEEIVVSGQNKLSDGAIAEKVANIKEY